MVPSAAESNYAFVIFKTLVIKYINTIVYIYLLWLDTAVASLISLLASIYFNIDFCELLNNYAAANTIFFILFIAQWSNLLYALFLLRSLFCAYPIPGTITGVRKHQFL